MNALCFVQMFTAINQLLPLIVFNEPFSNVRNMPLSDILFFFFIYTCFSSSYTSATLPLLHFSVIAGFFLFFFFIWLMFTRNEMKNGSRFMLSFQVVRMLQNGIFCIQTIIWRKKERKKERRWALLLILHEQRISAIGAPSQTNWF